MFDLEKLMTTTSFDVCAIGLTLLDERSGKIIDRTLFRPGKVYPKERIIKEFAKYGYKVMRIGEPGDVPGQINWEEVFEAFMKCEKVGL